MHKNHNRGETERNMVLQILIFSPFLAIIGHTLYRLVVRYLDYQVSWRQGTNRKILLQYLLFGPRVFHVLRPGNMEAILSTNFKGAPQLQCSLNPAHAVQIMVLA